MPVSFDNRPGRFAQVVKMAELMRHARQCLCHRPADRRLAVADHAGHRNTDGAGHFPQQRDQVGCRAGQQGAGQQHFAREAVAHHPQHLVSGVRLQAINRQDHPSLRGQQGAQPAAVGQRGRQQLVVTVEQVGDAALSDRHAPRAQSLVDLGDAAVVAMAQHPDQRDHVQAELVLRQRNEGFRLRPVGPVMVRAIGMLAAADLQPQSHPP